MDFIREDHFPQHGHGSYLENLVSSKQWRSWWEKDQHHGHNYSACFFLCSGVANAQRVLLSASLSNRLIRAMFPSVLLELLLLWNSIEMFFLYIFVLVQTWIYLVTLVGSKKVHWFLTQLCGFDEHHPVAFARLKKTECKFQMNSKAIFFIAGSFQIKPQCPFLNFFTIIFAWQKHSLRIDWIIKLQYLNVSALFLLPRYVGNLPRIFDYSPLDPTQDFNTQM